MIACRPGATSQELDAAEAREGAPLPPSVRDLLAISNGVGIGPHEVLGTEEIRTLTLEGERLWILAELEDAHFALMAPTWEQVAAMAHDASAKQAVTHASLKEFVAGLLLAESR